MCSFGLGRPALLFSHAFAFHASRLPYQYADPWYVELPLLLTISMFAPPL